MLEKVDDMAMGGCFFNGDFSEDIDGLCAVCRASVDESNDGCADEVHDICKDFFTDVDLGAIDPDGYVSVLRSSNCADLKEIEGTSGLVLVDDLVVFKPAICPPERLMIIFAALLLVLLIAFIVFAILVNEDLVHIPGISPEFLITITKWIGVGLLATLMFHSLLDLGYLLGREDDARNKRCRDVLSSCESKLKDLEGVQKEIGEGMSDYGEELGSRASALRLVSVIPESKRTGCSCLETLLSSRCSSVIKSCEAIKSKLES